MRRASVLGRRHASESNLTSECVNGIGNLEITIHIYLNIYSCYSHLLTKRKRRHREPPPPPPTTIHTPHKHLASTPPGVTRLRTDAKSHSSRKLCVQFASSSHPVRTLEISFLLVKDRTQRYKLLRPIREFAFSSQ